MEMVTDIRMVQAVIIVGIIVVFALVIFHDWFFGEKEIDDRYGFPYSRKK
jgi:hypothetical protein